jgi:class 3 adenylate cyclase/CHASE2 domain-containing sensor protein
VKLRPFKHVPGLVAGAVILLVCLLRVVRWEWAEREERATFDMRAREALKFSPPVATNLGFVFIDEDSLKKVANGSLGFKFGLEWPRQVYGRLINELAQQGAKAIALDIIFGELRPDHPPVQMADLTALPDSDVYFAGEMRRAGNVILALTSEVTPPALFLTNAPAVADITTEKDKPEGILRRVKAFRLYRKWHPAFLQLASDPGYGVDLSAAIVQPGKLVLPRHGEGLEDIQVPLDSSGNFAVSDFWGDTLPPGIARKARPFTEERVWHMGVVLAARELNLDLSRAFIDLLRQRIVLGGTNGVQRVLPIDSEGYFYIDWCLPEDHPQFTRESIQDLLAQHRLRLTGHTNDLANRWRGKLAVVGSRAVVGNNMTDRGATPVEADTILVSKHWNVANSIIAGRFVTRTPLWLDLTLIVVLGVASGLLTWNLRVLVATAMVALLLTAYVLTAVVVYIQTRYWIPLILPVLGSQLMTYVCLIAWRVIFEQAERRRVRSIFSTMVSPKIVHELLQAKTLSLVGARREITVLFADVRGFTTLTDSTQEQVARFVRENNLTGAAAEAAFDEQARETFATINLYLGTVADTIKQQDGTHDKFIGDCVMAFWGAPTPNPKHALACVRAAVQAQRAIYELNRQRAEENRYRETENRERAKAGVAPKPLLPILFLGTGINTGMATVGLMGSTAKGIVREGSYTVFGREVNLASRLESASGRGHIYVGETTYQHLLRDDPSLAATCIALPGQKLKGISTAVTAYEVPWQSPGAAPFEEEFSTVAPSHVTSFTTFVQRG